MNQSQYAFIAHITMSNSDKTGPATKASAHAPKKTKQTNDYKSLNGGYSDNIDNHIKQNKKFNATSRKNQISINHLLDFQLYRDLPEFHQNQQYQRNRRNPGNPKNRRQKLYLHGMRFINVNYKFVVDYRKSYKPQQIDPNIPVDTQDILRIIVPKGNACPICLSEDLVAPRMITSCGHILCLTCLLSLLESEVPVHKKRESKVIVEKYNDCPLCGSIIRKHDVKPVQVDNIDERFEIPKPKDEIVLTLMSRSSDSIVPLPRHFESYRQAIDLFPWANQTNPDLSQYLRFFKGDLSYLLSMYEEEKKQMILADNEDRELYQSDGKLLQLALKNIDEDIAKWTEAFSQDLPKEQTEPKESSTHSQSTYYYYQTGFKSSTTYVLSPLDVKVIKSSYNQDYTQLPNSVIVKVESIRYEELTAETASTKYKYLSHLPQGTTIGFIECNWKNNEYITEETWATFKNDLFKRSKISLKKLRTEELNKRKAISEGEKSIREFINRENNGLENGGESENWASSSFSNLTISDYADLPVLSNEPKTDAHLPESEKPSVAMEKTVWGTTIPRGEVKDINGDDNNDWDAEEMIRKAREEMERLEAQSGPGKKKKKKKIVLLSSGSAWS